MSTMRIVLVDPLGDVLFSGESWQGQAGESAAFAQSDDAPETELERGHDDEVCPRTLRSGGSGIFPVERANPANEVDELESSVPTLRKRDGRAA